MILPFYPSGKCNYPVKGIETMLRMYLMQIWFNRSDVAIEDAIYDSYATRTFMLHGLSGALISRRNRFRNQLLCGNSGIFLNSTIMVRKSLQI